METRSLLATFNWTAGADGDFGTASSWTNAANPTQHLVPGPADNAVIPAGLTVTSSASRTVNSVDGALTVASGTFTLNNVNEVSDLTSLEVSSGAILKTASGQTSIRGSEIFGTLNSVGTGVTRFQRQQNNLNFGAALTGNGHFLVEGDAGGTPTVSLLTNITAPANFVFAHGVINGGGNLTIGGTFEWMGNGSGTTMAGSGTTIVLPGANLHIGATTGGATLNQRLLKNQGTINYDAPGEFVVSGSAIIENAVGANFNLLVPRNINGRLGGNLTGSLNNAGTFTRSGPAGPATLDMFVNNTGTMNVQVGTLVTRFGQSTGGTFFAAATTTFNLIGGGTRTFEGDVQLQGSGTFRFDAGDQAVSPQGAKLTLASTASLFWVAGSITVPQNATFEIVGKVTQNANAGDVTLRGGGTLKMSGELVHKGTGNLVMSGDVGTNQVPTVLQIPATRHYTFQSDAGITETGAGGILTNAGIVRKSGGTGTSLIVAAVQNTKKLSSNIGTLAFREVTTVGGEVSTQAGATLLLTDNGSAAFTLSGTVTGTGGGTVKVGSGTLTANGAATVAVPAAVTLLWDDGSIAVANTLNINGNFSLAPLGQIRLTGVGKLRVNGEINNSGPGQLVLQGSLGTPSTLEIPATRRFTFLADGSITQSGSGGKVVNFGEIRKTAGTGISSITSGLESTATVNAASGILVLAPVNGLMNGGTLIAAAGAILDLTGGTTVSYQGTFTGSGAGEIRLQSGTINVAGGLTGLTFNLPGSLFRMSGGGFATNGLDVTLSGASMITGANGIDINGGGTFRLKGTLTHSGTGNLRLGGGTVLSVDSGALYNFQNNADITLSSGAASMRIVGSLRKGAGSGLTTVEIPVDNDGLVDARRGTLRFTGGVDQVVGTTLTGGQWQVVSTASTTAALDVGTDLLKIGLEATVTLNGPNCDFVSIFNVDNIAGKFNLFGGASFQNAGSLANSGKITVGAGCLLNVSGQYSQTSTGTVTYNGSGSTLGRIRTLTGSVLAGKLTVAWSGTKPAVGTVFTIVENQGANPVNGTFQGLGQNATFTTSGMTFRISYSGGSGNDVTLTRTA